MQDGVDGLCGEMEEGREGRCSGGGVEGGGRQAYALS